MRRIRNGINTNRLNKNVKKVVLGYMTMSADNMGDKGDIGMAAPSNSLPMIGDPGRYDHLTMLKVRNLLSTDVASETDLKRDGITL